MSDEGPKEGPQPGRQVATTDRSTDRDAPLDKPTEPPVVARMVIEIRSDGTRTIARGAMEDVTLGQRVAVEAEGTSPAALAASLLKQLTTLPFAASSAPAIVKQVVKSLLPGRKPKPDRDR